MKSIDHAFLPHPQITDVAYFFAEITNAYHDFEQRVLLLLHTIPIYSPEQIFNGCKNLAKQRERLAILDQRLFAIIELAGKVIVNTPMVHDYRVAFAKASMACHTLQQKLLALRATLPSDLV